MKRMRRTARGRALRALLASLVLFPPPALLPPSALPAWVESAPPGGGYVLPASATTIERLFDPPDLPWLRGHRGVDLAAGVGAPVRAPAAGEVTFVGRVVDREVLTITHDDGLRSSLEPVTAAVALGDRVPIGAVVGAVTAEGAAHCRAGCLHWGVRTGETYLDPLRLVGTAPVVLLP